MNELKLAALVFTAVLNGMKTVYGVEIYKEKEEPFWKVWNCRWLYICGAVSLGVFVLIYYLGKGQMYYLRYADLLYTYLLLAIVDLKTRIVPDRILFLFLTGQLLMAGTEGLIVLTAGLLGGLILGAVVLLVAATSGEKMGMGDGKLLAVTAIAAGWSYTLCILCIAMGLFLICGIWRILFRHSSMKAEMPFVPFLFLGTVIYFIWF